MSTLEGSVNFRDLGGLTTIDGRQIQPGRLYRSDALHHLTENDVVSLRTLGIATLIDLRGPAEVKSSPPSLLLNHGTRHLHLPLLDADITADPNDPEFTLASLYAGILEERMETFLQVFLALAEPATLPAVIHCAAGKDRTGITVALILRAIGVPDEAIVADYAVTDANFARLIAQLSPEQQLSYAQVPDVLKRAEPATMTAMLTGLDAIWGSIDGYLVAANIDPETVSRLRTHLLQE